jgi:hypothetical protein
MVFLVQSLIVLKNIKGRNNLTINITWSQNFTNQKIKKVNINYSDLKAKCQSRMTNTQLVV